MASRVKLVSLGRMIAALAVFGVLGGCVAFMPASGKWEITSASIPDVTQTAARAARELDWVVKQMDTASGFLYCEKIIYSSDKVKPFYMLEVQAATSTAAGMVTLLVKATPPPGGNIHANEKCDHQVEAFMKKFNELKK
jgi:hypothetical protein